VNGRKENITEREMQITRKKASLKHGRSEQKQVSEKNQMMAILWILAMKQLRQEIKSKNIVVKGIKYNKVELYNNTLIICSFIWIYRHMFYL